MGGVRRTTHTPRAPATRPADRAASPKTPTPQVIRDGLDPAVARKNAIKPGASAGQAGWLGALGPTQDVTADFKSSLAQVKAGQARLPADARDCVYLVVPGLFGDQTLGYMQPNVDALKKQGLDARLVPLDTQAPVATNAEHIADALRAVELRNPGKQVVFVTHSKGGLDVTAALTLHPELQKDVRALVAIQAPYGGSPVATDMVANPIARQMMEGTMRGLFGGNPEAVKDLSYESRKAFVAQHPFPTDRIPTWSVATSRPPLQAGNMALTDGYIQSVYGWANDGVVVADDAKLPGSKVIRLEDMDHSDSSQRWLPGVSHYDPGQLTLALVGMALRDTAARAGPG